MTLHVAAMRVLVSVGMCVTMQLRKQHVSDSYPNVATDYVVGITVSYILAIHNLQALTVMQSAQSNYRRFSRVQSL